MFGLRPTLYGKTTLEKGHFQYAVKPGSSLQDAVEVINSSGQTLTLALYAADMEQASDGSLAPKDASQKMTSVGRWIELERSEVTVRPHDSRFVSFDITVPRDIGPGDHVGAVVASAVMGRTESGLNIESRVALIARIRIPGSPELEAHIGPLSVRNGRAFTVEVENTGNLLFTAKGLVDISTNGRRVASIALDPPDIYLIPGGRATFHATWASPPLFGTRQAVVSLDTTSPKVPFERLTSDPVSMSYFDRRFVVMAVLLVLIVAAIVVGARRRRPRSDQPTSVAPVDALMRP